MKKRLSIIYIPGLGDAKVTTQRFVVKTWRVWGVRSETFQMRWADKEPWQLKLNRLLSRIEQLNAEGYAVGLVGASAGAAAVINAYAARKDIISACVLISGKVNRADLIGQEYKYLHPAFVRAVKRCEKALQSLSLSDRSRILSRYAAIDTVVDKTDSYIPGAYNQVLPIIGHRLTIATQLVFGGRSIAKFLNVKNN